MGDGVDHVAEDRERGSVIDSADIDCHRIFTAEIGAVADFKTDGGVGGTIDIRRRSET